MLFSLLFSLGVLLIGGVVLAVMYFRRRDKKPEEAGFIPVVRIADGCIETPHGYSAVLKLTPVNYYLLTPEEQSAFEAALMEALRSLDIPVQFFTTARSVDMRGPASELRQIGMRETGVRAVYARSLAAVLDNVVKVRTLKTRDACIVVSDPERDKADVKAARVAEMFARAKVRSARLQDAELADFLYEVLNRDPLFKPSQAVEKGALSEFAVGKGVVVGAGEPDFSGRS